VGVNVESTGLAYACPYDGGTPRDDELKEDDDEPERPEAAMARGSAPLRRRLSKRGKVEFSAEDSHFGRAK
jgi:hypothetical protein